MGWSSINRVPPFGAHSGEACESQTSGINASDLGDASG